MLSNLTKSAGVVYKKGTMLLLLVIPSLCFSQVSYLNFKHINVEQGLSNSTIQTIFQDSRGFIWIGTQYGLNRYDGYNVTVYKNDPANSASLSDNDIQSIYEDQEHNIWVGTVFGLNRFNPNNNSFTRYKHEIGNPKSLSNNYVTFIAGDKDDDLWICTHGGGLDLFNLQTGTFTHYMHTEGRVGAISDNHVNYFYEDIRGAKWVATNHGLNLFNKKNSTFKVFSGNSSILESADIRIINGDKAGNLWLGTQNSGLILFNPSNNLLKAYRHSEKIPTSIAKNQISSILFDSKGELWVGTVDGGLDLYDRNKDGFFHYNNADPTLSNSNLTQLTVSVIFEDNQKNLWLGTQRGGINLYTPSSNKFKLYRHQLDPNSLSCSDVTSVYQDLKGNIWIGTQLGGLNLFNRTKNTFEHFRHNPLNAKTIGSDVVLDTYQDRDGNFWVGTWGGGLDLFNSENGTFTRFLNNPQDKNSISSDYVQKIFEDDKGTLWVGTYYGGLETFNRSTKTFKRFTGSKHVNGDIFLGDNIVSINEDKNENLWIGTDDGGLNCYNLQSQKVSHYFNKEDKMPNLRVIFVDSKRRVWIGQIGLYLYDPSQKKFHLYTQLAGLANEFIKGITEDDQGNLWISSTNGLTRFNPDTYTFKKYNMGDGLQGLEFENACLKSKSGEMFFGGTNGLNTFYPGDIPLNRFVPPVYITAFQIFNKDISVGNNSPLTQDITFTDRIALSYKQSTLSFTFAALNFTAPENNQYAYKLEGFDKDWNYIGNQRKAFYTNLDPGQYIFRVKAANNDGVWNESGTSIRVIITPPFWKTSWFTVLIIVIVIGSTYLLLCFKRSLELKELEEKKKEEIHKIQLQFFTNISHELRTPLTLILGTLENLLTKRGPLNIAHSYNLMHRNTTRIISLVNELMDFRKVEEGFLKLKVIQGDLSLFINEIAEEFKDLALSKKIIFKINKPVTLPDTWFDPQILEKIILNLVHNSFKYTSDESHIVLEILEPSYVFKPVFENHLIVKSNYRGKNYIHIRVLDDGCGISKDSIQHLFDRYYRINNLHLGSGIGLPFVKSLTSLHKGDIYVSSERNKGTEIIIGLPVHRDDYTIDEKWLISTEEGGVSLESIDYKFFLPIENTSELTLSDKKNPNKHILVVDDNTELLNFFQECLSSLYVVSTASDGESGLAKARELFPDLIISDIMMPRMNGIDYCKAIREDITISHIPFIMLTAKGALKSKIEGVESGADFYFEKPVSISLLLLTIRNIFDQKEKLKERYTSDFYLNARELVHSSKDKVFMDKLIYIIELQLVNPELDVDYLCCEIGMSKTKLYQKIKHITGQSIGEFIRSIRLRNAVHIMTHEDIPLTEVTLRVGIQTQSYFTKAFKKEFGKTPSQFLNEVKRPE